MSCLMQEIVVSAVVMGAFLSSVIGGMLSHLSSSP